MSDHEYDDDRYEDDFDPDVGYYPSHRDPVSPSSRSMISAVGDLSPKRGDSFKPSAPGVMITKPAAPTSLSPAGRSAPPPLSSSVSPVAAKPRNTQPATTNKVGVMSSIATEEGGLADDVSVSASVVEDPVQTIAKLKAVNSKLRAQLMELNQILSEQLNQAGEKVLIKSKAKVAVPAKEAQLLQKELDYYRKQFSDLRKKQVGVSHDADRITALENLAAERQLEIDRLKEENKGLLAVQREQTKALESLGGGEDLQRAMRAYAEDARVLKERLRKANERATEAEKTVKGQHETIITLKERCKKMRDLLELKGLSPEDMPNAKMSQLIEEKDKIIEDLTYKNDVLTKAVTGERKRVKGAQQQYANETTSLRAQVESLTAALADKEKELRLALIQARTGVTAPLNQPSAVLPTIMKPSNSAPSSTAVHAPAQPSSKPRAARPAPAATKPHTDRGGGNGAPPSLPPSKTAKDRPGAVAASTNKGPPPQPPLSQKQDASSSQPPQPSAPQPPIPPQQQGGSAWMAKGMPPAPTLPPPVVQSSQPADDYGDDFEPIDELEEPPKPVQPPPAPITTTTGFKPSTNFGQPTVVPQQASTSFNSHWSAMGGNTVDSGDKDPLDLGIMSDRSPRADDATSFKPGPFGAGRRKKMPFISPVEKS